MTKHYMKLFIGVIILFSLIFVISKVEAIEESKCSDCGKGLFNICDKKECNNLGNCLFSDPNFLPGGSCRETIEIEKPTPIPTPQTENKCLDCGKGVFNLWCDEDECKKLGNNCEFNDPNWLPGGTCKDTIKEEKPASSQPTTPSRIKEGKDREEPVSKETTTSETETADMQKPSSTKEIECGERIQAKAFFDDLGEVTIEKFSDGNYGVWYGEKDETFGIRSYIDAYNVKGNYYNFEVDDKTYQFKVTKDLNCEIEVEAVGKQQLPITDIFYSDFPLATPKKIVLVVDTSTYKTLKTEIDRFANDIFLDINSKVKILSKEYASVWEVKASLIKEKEDNGDFEGAIFIGDVPWQYVNLKGLQGVFDAIKPSDAWIIDLDDNNIYTDKIDTQCIIDSSCSKKYIEVNAGEGYKEIPRWSGRILPPIGKTDRIELLKQYFNRNHNYRQGNINYEGALVYGPDSTLNNCKQFDECFSAVKNQIVDTARITTEDKLDVIVALSPDESTKNTYLSKQKELHKFELVNAHGTETFFVTSKGDSVTYSDLVNNPPGALFSSFFSCSVGSFDVKDNLVTAYIFEGMGLAAYASTVPIFIVSPFISHSTGDLSIVTLGVGGRLYEAFPTIHFSHILGDPTIRINKPSQGGCKLAFNQTNIDFGDIKISGWSFENPNDAYKRIKIRNEGTDTCYLGYIEVSGLASGYGFYKNIGDVYAVELNKIEPGEIIEFSIGTGIARMDVENPNKIIRSLGIVRFITNDPQYTKSIPVQGTFIKTKP